MDINIPYGDGSISLSLPDSRVIAALCPAGGAESGTDGGQANDVAAQAQTVRAALSRPVGGMTLQELASGKGRITIITSDHTRPMPSAVTMPILLEEIRKGSKGAEITILVATGLHRATTESELEERFGREIYGHEKIIVHDCMDESALAHIGALPSGGELSLSKYALDTDLLIAEGFIEPHFFAGFSGGRKSVLPGVAGFGSVVANHCSSFIADENAAAGKLEGNPIHRDMEYAAEKASLAFILNVMIDEGQAVIDAVAGDPKLAHAEGCRRLMERASVKRAAAPIVITSNGGYPLDQNLYQLVKCMDTAEKCCDEGGVIIAVGECRDGVGGETFYRDFAGGKSARELTERFLSCGQSETPADQWQSQILARILEKHSVIVVAPLIEEAVKGMGLGFAHSIPEALNIADDMLGLPSGKAPGIVVIPNGPGVVVV